jgi:signal transduction histidine kinase
MNVISHLRRAVRRHAHLADVAITVTVFAATLLTTFTGHEAASVGTSPTAVVSAAVACGVLAVRRRHPLEVLVVSAGASEVFLAHLAKTGGTSGALILLAPLIALFTVADQVERRRGLVLGGCVVLALGLVHIVHRPVMLGSANLAFIALGALAIAAGDSSHNRRAYLAEVEHRAERAEREREQDAQRRLAEERLRIARDLHDAVGHQLALISVQSEVAGRAMDSDAPAAREALGHVKSASRKALGELRDTIGLLRRPGDPVAPVDVPAPGLDGLEELLASLRASGLDIDFRVDGGAVCLTPAADLTAYRVIQESLTNVAKHSAGRKARLSLAYDRHRLAITVEDLVGGGNSVTDSGGHGIRGMRERVQALGGSFVAGPRPDGTFQVTAALPYQPLKLAPEHHQ